MPSFDFIARRSGGEEVRAALDAASRFDALAELRRRGLTVVALNSPGDDASEAVPGEERVAEPRRRRRGTAACGHLSLGEKALFFRQLATSVGAGVPLREAVESIAEDVTHRGFRRVLDDVLEQLREGHVLSAAIAPHRGVFSPLMVALLRSAEESGSMPQTLEDLAHHLEKSDRLARKVRSITAYPLFVAVFFCVVCLVLTLVVLPRFQSIFTGFKVKLPRLTLAVFGFNRLLLQSLPFLAAGLAAAVAVFGLWVRTPGGRAGLDRLKLRLPLFGSWIHRYSAARFCRNLAMMVRGGVPIASAIEIAAETCGNRALELALRDALARVLDGMSVSHALAAERVFPRLVIRMVSVGESTGRLPEVLEKVSDVYEDQVEGSIMTATALFEPVVICVFGAVVLVLVMAIYLPVFTVASHMR